MKVNEDGKPEGMYSNSKEEQQPQEPKKKKHEKEVSHVGRTNMKNQHFSCCKILQDPNPHGSYTSPSVLNNLCLEHFSFHSFAL